VVQGNALTPSAGGRGRVLPRAERLGQAEVPGDTAAILPTRTVTLGASRSTARHLGHGRVTEVRETGRSWSGRAGSLQHPDTACANLPIM